MTGTSYEMYYTCLPLDHVLALLGYHQDSVQGTRASGYYQEDSRMLASAPRLRARASSL